MRKVTQQIVNAFVQGRKLKSGNTETDGNAIWLHGNKIAEKRDGALYITNAGWASNTTKERLNGLPDVTINQKAGVWYLNGKEWDGEWAGVCNFIDGRSMKSLNAVSMVAKMANIFCDTQEAKNDWKARMLKAGYNGLGLSFPEDWNTLSEDEKTKRLDEAINILQ